MIALFDVSLATYDLWLCAIFVANLKKWRITRLAILRLLSYLLIYSKTCLKLPLSKRQNNGLQDRLSLNAGQKYCRMLQRERSAIFRPSLSYQLQLRPLYCLFLSGRFRRFYCYAIKKIIPMYY